MAFVLRKKKDQEPGVRIISRSTILPLLRATDDLKVDWLVVSQHVLVSEVMTRGLGFRFNHFGLHPFNLFSKTEVLHVVYFY